MDSIIILTAGIVVGLIVFFVISKVLAPKNQKLQDDLESKIDKTIFDALDKANKQLILLASEQLQSEKKQIQTDLSNKKTAIEDLVKLIKEEMDDTNKKLEQTDKDRIGAFRALVQQMEEINKVNAQLTSTTESLKQVLSNNQLRGQFGEQVADNLLKMTGFVKGTDYEANKEQAESEKRPDFSVFLPDGTRVNIDAKFPYKNLQKLIETPQEDDEARKRYLAAFKKDVQEKVKQVTSREYINPEGKTVDFVILFIPNEMIFSFIYEKMNEVWEEAMNKKVVFAGPFNFTAILRLIKQAYDNFRLQKNAQSIIGHIRSFESEFVKYNEEFTKIGDRIVSLNQQYEKVNSTRRNQLIRTVDKIKLEEKNKVEEKTAELPLIEKEVE